MLNILKEFFAMGGYGFYIWTAYSITFIVLLLNFVIPSRQHKHFIKKNESSS